MVVIIIWDSGVLTPKIHIRILESPYLLVMGVGEHLLAKCLTQNAADTKHLMTVIANTFTGIINSFKSLTEIHIQSSCPSTVSRWDFYSPWRAKPNTELAPVKLCRMPTQTSSDSDKSDKDRAPRPPRPQAVSGLLYPSWLSK